MTTEEFKNEMIKLMEKVENSEELTSDEVNYIVQKVDKTSDLYLLFEKNYEIIHNLLDPFGGIKAISYKKLHESKNDLVEELIEEDESKSILENISDMYESVEENVSKMLNEDLENDLAGFVPPSLEELENNIELLKSEQSLLKVICDAFHITTTEFTEFKTIKGFDLKTGEDFYKPDLYKFKHEKDLFRFCDLIEGIKIKIEKELEENRSNYLIITATGIDILHKYGSLYNEFSDNGAHEITDTNSKVILKSIYDKYTKDIQQELDITDDYILTLTSTIKLCKDIIKIAKDEFYSQSEDMEATE